MRSYTKHEHNIKQPTYHLLFSFSVVTFQVSAKPGSNNTTFTSHTRQQTYYFYKQGHNRTTFTSKGATILPFQAGGNNTSFTSNVATILLLQDRWQQFFYRRGGNNTTLTCKVSTVLLLQARWQQDYFYIRSGNNTTLTYVRWQQCYFYRPCWETLTVCSEQL